MTVAASPDGRHVLWCRQSAAGITDLAGSLNRPIELKGVFELNGLGASIAPIWSPDGRQWMLAHYGHGVDYSYVYEVCEGTPESRRPTLGATKAERTAPSLLEAEALAPDGRIIGTDGGRGAFNVDPRTLLGRPFVLEGLEKEAYRVQLRTTASGKLVWSCYLWPEQSPIPLIRWLRERMDDSGSETFVLRVNRLDGTGDREVGRVRSSLDSGGWPRLDGVSRDGKWVDFETAGKLYTTRLP